MANSKRYLYSHTQAQRFAWFFFGSVTSLSQQHFLLQPIRTPLPVWNSSWLSSCSFCNGLNVLTLPPVMSPVFTPCVVYTAPVLPPPLCISCVMWNIFLFLFFTLFWPWWKCSRHCMACYLLHQTVAYHPLFLAPSVFLVLMPVLKSNIFLSAAAEREKVGMESKRRSFAACHLFPLPSRHLGNLVFIS